MRRIDDRTVELTGANENGAHVKFHRYLDEGLTIPEAVAKVKHEYGSALSKAFYDWLND